MSDEEMKQPMIIPTSEVGYANHSRDRLESHAAHVSSNFEMNIVEHGALAEVSLVSRISTSTTEEDSATILLVSTTPRPWKSNPDRAKWEEWAAYAMLKSPYRRNLQRSINNSFECLQRKRQPMEDEITKLEKELKDKLDAQVPGEVARLKKLCDVALSGGPGSEEALRELRQKENEAALSQLEGNCENWEVALRVIHVKLGYSDRHPDPQVIELD